MEVARKSNAKKLRFPSSSPLPLGKNSSHVFAQQHALSLYRRQAVYSYIPKNACSNLRFSAAVDNGYLSSNADPSWIHNNNGTFTSSNSFLSTAEYAFVFLRCPYRRIASVFLDKIVNGDKMARSLEKSLPRKLWVEYISTRPILGNSFLDFVTKIALTTRERQNHHWRPQIDFLVYENYDDFFCIEKFHDAEKTLEKKIGFKVIDARARIGHDTSRFKKITGEFTREPAHAIRELKRQGTVPAYESLYNDEVKEIVDRIYLEDIELYKTHFGTSSLLFTA